MKLRRVYLVDDEVELLEIYTDVLAKSYELKTFHSPRDLMEAVEGGDIPDVLITDLNMPDMSGVELLEWFRGLNIRKPVVIISGFSDKPMIVRALKLGNIQVIEKPFSIELFKSVVRGAVASSLYQDLQATIVDGFYPSFQALSQMETAYEAGSFSALLQTAKKNFEKVVSLDDEINNLMK